MSREKAQAALEALREATLFALVQGDIHTAAGRKAVGNAFYNILPILAKAKQPLSELTADEVWPKVAPQPPMSWCGQRGRLLWLARECESPEGLGSGVIAQRIREILGDVAPPLVTTTAGVDVATNRIDVPLPVELENIDPQIILRD